MKRFSVIISFVFLLLQSSYDAGAGNYLFEHIQLSNHWINSIYQDKDGFMWLGTRNGLYRYIGDEIIGHDVVFEGESFFDIQQDKDGRIWGKKRNGYVIYNPQSSTFLDEQQTASHLEAAQWIEVLHIDEKGSFWWNEGQDVYMLRYGAETKVKASAVEGRIYDIYCRNDVAYVLTVEGYLYRFDYSKENVKALPVMGPATMMPEDNIDYRFHCVFVDSAQNIWLSQGAHGVWFYPAGSSEGRYLNEGNHANSIQGGFICAIEEDAEGNVWLASDHGGISVCSKDGRVIALLKNEPDDGNTLAGNGVYALFRDRNDNIWVGYTKNGLSVYRGENKIWSMMHVSGLLEDNKLDDINSTCVDNDGNVWLGTDGYGLIRIDARNRSETRYLVSNSALESNVITDIHCDMEGRIWIGTFYGGLSCIENGRMKTYSCSEDPATLASMNVWSIDQDRTGRIWIGTLGGGLQMLDPVTGRFDTFSSEDGAISNDFIHKIECADDGNIYVATTHGLSIFNPQTKSSRVVSGQDMLHVVLTGLKVDSRGLVWLDEDGILQVYDPMADRFHTPEHSSFKAVRDIVEDRSGAVWVVTDKGLCRVDVYRSSEHGYAFETVAFGFPQLKDLHFNQRSTCVDDSGDFLIGSFCGYMHFSPEKYTSDPANDAELHFVRLYAGNELLYHALEYEESVTLDYDESVISVVFASLDYLSIRERNLYYRMDGISDQWIVTDRNSNRLIFTNLTPGKYRLRLTSDISDPSKCISLNIRIMPPWWATWWAIVVYVLIFFAGCVAIWFVLRRRSREKALLLEQSMKQERRHYVDEMKMQFFTNVSHDFRTPLTLILTPIEERISKNPELKDDPFIMTVHRNAKRLNDLVNEVLDFRRIEMYGAELEMVTADLVSTVNDAAVSFRLMAESQSVTLEINSSEDSVIFDFDNGKIMKVITNLLSNAFKFTPSGGKVSIDVVRGKDGFVTVEVKDTGCGIADKDKKRIFDRFYQVKGNASGSGIGLHVVKEFVVLHGGEVDVRDNQPCGTVFSFTMPMRESVNSAAEDIAVASGTSSGSSDDSRPSVLVVDDNDDFRTFMCASLSGDYDVLSASNGLDALKVVEDNDIDVVISDVMMPLMDGMEFCRRMKSDINTSHIPVILLTAKSMQDDECHGLESGADDYLTKPFNMSILRLRIAKFIEWKKRSKRLFEKELEITTDQITITSMDDRLLQSAINVINENISNPDFSVTDLSAALFMHRASLYKKLLYITGKTPIEFIRAIRLKRAAALLETDGVYISEVAYMVGFNSPKIFASHFKEEFGCSPSDYRKKHSTSAPVLR